MPSRPGKAVNNSGKVSCSLVTLPSLFALSATGQLCSCTNKQNKRRAIIGVQEISLAVAVHVCAVSHPSVRPSNELYLFQSVGSHFERTRIRILSCRCRIHLNMHLINMRCTSPDYHTRCKPAGWLLATVHITAV